MAAGYHEVVGPAFARHLPGWTDHRCCFSCFFLLLLKFFYGDVSQVYFLYIMSYFKKIFNFLFFRELLVTNGRGPTRGGSGGYVRHLLGRIVSQRLFF